MCIVYIWNLKSFVLTTCICVQPLPLTKDRLEIYERQKTLKKISRMEMLEEQVNRVPVDSACNRGCFPIIFRMLLRDFFVLKLHLLHDDCFSLCGLIHNFDAYTW